MAKLFYQLGGGGGTQLNVYDDPQVLIQGDLEDQLPSLQEIAALSDETRTFIASSGLASLGLQPQNSLADFDDVVNDEIERLQDILDYFDYESKVENLTVRDGEWIVPVALESVSHEEVGSEGILSIDGDNGTWWQSETSGTRTIVYRIQDWRKTCEKIRLRISNSGEGRVQLQNVTIKASQNINLIDDPGNVIDTEIDFVWGGSNWMEHTFTNKKRAKYLKLEVATSLHSNADHVRIREIQVRTGITNHDK